MRGLSRKRTAPGKPFILVRVLAVRRSHCVFQSGIGKCHRGLSRLLAYTSEQFYILHQDLLGRTIQARRRHYAAATSFLFQKAYFASRDTGRRLVYWGCGRRDDVSRVRNVSRVVYSSKRANQMSWVQVQDLSFSSRKDKSEPRPLSGM